TGLWAGDGYQGYPRDESREGGETRIGACEARRRRETAAKNGNSLVVRIRDVRKSVPQSPEVVRVHADSVARPNNSPAPESVSDANARGKHPVSHINAVILRHGANAANDTLHRCVSKV